MFCNKQAEEVRKSQPPGYEPQINPEMAIDMQVYFQSKEVINVKNMYKQIHCHTHEDTQTGHLKKKMNKQYFLSID